jgi:cupin 2 domain-containing protein
MNAAIRFLVMKINNLFKNMPVQAPAEIFETLWENQAFTLERIISTGQASPVGEWYDQAWDEWVILLQGRAGLEFQDEIHQLQAGDYVLIPAHCQHRVAWTDNTQPTLWLALHVKPAAGIVFPSS